MKLFVDQQAPSGPPTLAASPTTATAPTATGEPVPRLEPTGPRTVAPTAAACGYGASNPIAQLEERSVKEGSGLASGRRQAGVYWTLNDSGNTPDLFAFDQQGRRLGTFRPDCQRDKQEDEQHRPTHSKWKGHTISWERNSTDRRRGPGAGGRPMVPLEHGATTGQGSPCGTIRIF